MKIHYLWEITFKCVLNLEWINCVQMIPWETKIQQFHFMHVWIVIGRPLNSIRTKKCALFLRCKLASKRLPMLTKICCRRETQVVLWFKMNCSSSWENYPHGWSIDITAICKFHYIIFAVKCKHMLRSMTNPAKNDEHDYVRDQANTSQMLIDCIA